MEQAVAAGTRLIMMHDGQIILHLNQEEKSRMTVQDLLDEFGKIKGAQLDDKTMTAVAEPLSAGPVPFSGCGACGG